MTWHGKESTKWNLRGAQIDYHQTKYYAISFLFFTKKLFPEFIPSENFGDEFQS